MRWLLLCCFAIRLLPASAADCVGLQAPMRLAEQSLTAGKPDEAEKLLVPLETDANGCPALLLMLGRTRQAEGLPSLARDLLTRYTMQVPSDPNGFVALAKTMLKQRDAESASAAVGRALKLDARNGDALLLQAELYESSGQLAQAEALFGQAAGVVPPSPEARFQLGVFYDRHHQAAQAVTAFRAVTKIDAENSFAWDYLALDLEAVGESTLAEAAYQSGLRVNRGSRVDRFLEYNYGRFLMKQNRLAESRPYLNRAVELAPETRAVFYERAKLNLLLQDLAASQADVQRALSLPDPGQYVQDVQLYALASTVAGRLGDADQARRYAGLARNSRLRSSGGGRQ